MNEEAQQVFKDIAALQETRSAPNFDSYYKPPPLESTSNDEEVEQPESNYHFPVASSETSLNPWNEDPLRSVHTKLI